MSAFRLEPCASLTGRLPAVVREGPVGLRHAVDVVLPLEGPALLVAGVEDLADELVDHLLLAALAGERDEPADREGAGAARRDPDRNLIVGTPHAARAHPQGGGGGPGPPPRHPQRRPAGP